MWSSIFHTLGRTEAEDIQEQGDREIFVPKSEDEAETGGNCCMRSFIICITASYGSCDEIEKNGMCETCGICGKE